MKPVRQDPLKGGDEQSGSPKCKMVFSQFNFLIYGGGTMGADLSWCIIYNMGIPVVAAVILIYYLATGRG